jgi:hypothetical protein
MGNPYRGEASFEVEGRTHRVHFTWNAAVAYEEATGRPLSDALLDLANGKLSARSLRAMLWAGLQEAGEDVTPKDAGRLIDRLGRKDARRILGVALRFFFPELEAEEAKATADPSQGTAVPLKGTDVPSGP